MTNDLMWWGYLHTNNKIQVKRYFNDIAFEDADESPFVVRRTNEFPAKDYEEAHKIILRELTTCQ